jgi:hypothetical protein
MVRKTIITKQFSDSTSMSEWMLNNKAYEVLDADWTRNTVKLDGGIAAEDTGREILPIAQGLKQQLQQQQPMEDTEVIKERRIAKGYRVHEKQALKAHHVNNETREQLWERYNYDSIWGPEGLLQK